MRGRFQRNLGFLKGEVATLRRRDLPIKRHEQARTTGAGEAGGWPLQSLAILRFCDSIFSKTIIQENDDGGGGDDGDRSLRLLSIYDEPDSFSTLSLICIPQKRKQVCSGEAVCPG